MAGVFLSYDRDDADRARHFARAFEKAGHEVWWDLHVRGGAQFSKVIEEALKAADAVVVLWSVNAVESPWVRDEAAAGRDSGRLVPVTIDGTEAPLGFRQFQTIDLSRWKGRGTSPELRALLADIAATLPAHEQQAHPSASRDSTKRTRTALRVDWRVAAAALVVAAIVAGLFVWRPWAARATPTLLIKSASADAASDALARELAAKLGSLESVQSAPVQLIGAADAGKSRPDLLLEVATASGAGSGSANLVLKTPKNGVILWSKDFDQGANLSDFKQQIAFTAGSVVGCAGDGLDPRQPRPSDDVLKTYINACAQLAELADNDPEPLVGSFREVVKRSPRFTAAWKRLLLVEGKAAEAANDEGRLSRSAAETIRTDIQRARELDASMPEAKLAQIALLSRNDLLGRMKLADEAKDADPDDPAVLHQRAIYLQSVGRMGEALMDSRRAVDLDPISPDAHAAFFNALLYADRLDPAQQELQQVERLWPDSSTARDLAFRFNLRNGDPRIALPRAQELGLLGLEKMLEARIDPAKVGPYIAWLTERRDYDFGRLGVLTQAFGQFHRENELYAMLFTWPNPGDLAKMDDLWFRPQLKQFRRDPRFMLVMARTPLLNYWRTSGSWPDFCFDPDLPYDCKKEAAKFAAGSA